MKNTYYLYETLIYRLYVTDNYFHVGDEFNFDIVHLTE